MKYRVITQSVNVRTLPDTVSGKVVSTLRKGAEFSAAELTPDKRWARSGLGWVCVFDKVLRYCELVPEPAAEVPAPPMDDYRAEVERRLASLERRMLTVEKEIF